MLPRSLFSASTLKSEGSANQLTSCDFQQYSSDNNSEDELLRKPNNLPIHTPNTMPTTHTISQLQSRLQEQYAKQTEYQEKLNEVNQSIKQTSEQLAQYAIILTQQSYREPNRHQASIRHQLPVKEPVREPVSKPVSEPSRASAVETFRLYGEPSRMSAAPAETFKSFGESSGEPRRQLARRSTPLPPLTQSILKRPRIETTLQTAPWASKTTMDVYTLRARQCNTAFAKKPRSLLYNIAQRGSEHMSNLLVTSSIAGEVQFWNAKKRQNIKVIGNDYLYNGWIEDMCWLNPTTLAIYPSKNSDEPIKTIQISSVTEHDVKGNVQVLGNCPHNGNVSMIGAVNPTEDSEIGRLVTGGYDHKAYLWTVRRKSATEGYIVDDKTELNIKHTSSLSAFSYNPYNNSIIIGGQDERLSVLDLATNTVLQTNRSTGRISQLIQDSQNPNIQIVVYMG
ncbi:unnamed protein product [Rhizopus stolonifer]